ncbi:C-type lectin-like isoform X2 [Crotalus tigris]|nr:C-type lectin-like isoform X2 [Crotalus tigris]
MTSRGACYSIFCEKRTWAEAEKDCRKHGTRAHLASILDEKETTAVSDYIVSLLIKNLGPVWIGMFYKGKNWPQEDWWWIDAYKVVYHNWAQALPEVSENKKYCIYLMGNEYKYWKDTDCKQRFGYICKYELKYQRR